MEASKNLVIINSKAKLFRNNMWTSRKKLNDVAFDFAASVKTFAVKRFQVD